MQPLKSSDISRIFNHSGPLFYRRVQACRILKNEEKLCEGIKITHPISLDVMDTSALDAVVGKNDVVVGSIPYIFYVDGDIFHQGNLVRHRKGGKIVR